MSRSTISNLAAGLVEAAHLVAGGYDRQARVDLPRTWDESLRDAVDAVVAAYHSGIDASCGVVAAA